MSDLPLQSCLEPQKRRILKNSVDSWIRFIYHSILVWIDSLNESESLVIQTMKKSITVLLVFIFSLSLLAATGFSQTDCGQVCCCSSKMHGMQHTTKLQARVGTDCCSQTPTHSCGITKNRNVELPLCTISVGRANTGTTVGAPLVHTASAVTTEFSSALQGWPVAKFLQQSLPLYLKHRSILIWSFS